MACRSCPWSDDFLAPGDDKPAQHRVALLHWRLNATEGPALIA
jgi:hypothetical protein